MIAGQADVFDNISTTIIQISTREDLQNLTAGLRLCYTSILLSGLVYIKSESGRRQGRELLSYLYGHIDRFVDKHQECTQRPPDGPDPAWLAHLCLERIDDIDYTNVRHYADREISFSEPESMAPDSLVVILGQVAGETHNPSYRLRKIHGLSSNSGGTTQAVHNEPDQPTRTAIDEECLRIGRSDSYNGCSTSGSVRGVSSTSAGQASVPREQYKAVAEEFKAHLERGELDAWTSRAVASDSGEVGEGGEGQASDGLGGEIDDLSP